MITIPIRCYCWDWVPIHYWGVVCCPIRSPWVAACRTPRSSWVAACRILLAFGRSSWVAACCRSSRPVQTWVVTRSLPSCFEHRSRAGLCRPIVPYSKDQHILDKMGGTVVTVHVEVSEDSLNIECPCSDQIIIDHVFVPDLNTKCRISAGVEDESVAPLGLLSSELTNSWSELLSSEVEFAVGVLNVKWRYHSFDEFSIVGEIGTDGTDSHWHW